VTQGSTGMFLQLGRIFIGLLAESYRHRFCFRQGFWVAALAVDVFVGVVLVALEAPPPVLLVPFLGLVALTVALGTRIRATRISKMGMLALISRFKPSTHVAESPSIDQRHAVIRSIRRDPYLGQRVEPRSLERLSKKQAETLLGECTARAVVYGEIRVQGDAYLVEGGICLRPPAAPGGARAGPAPPTRHVPLEEDGRPLRELVGTPEANYFGVIRAELLNLAVALRV